MSLLTVIPLVAAALYLSLANLIYDQAVPQQRNYLVAAYCLGMGLVFFVVFQFQAARTVEAATFWSGWLLLLFPTTAIGFHLAWQWAGVPARFVYPILAVVYGSALLLALLHPFVGLLGMPVRGIWNLWTLAPSRAVGFGSIGLVWLLLLTLIWTVRFITAPVRLADPRTRRRRQVLLAGLVVPALIDALLFLLLLAGTRLPVMEILALAAVSSGSILFYGTFHVRIFAPTPEPATHDMLWSLAEGVAIITPEGTIRLVNPALCQQTGYREADLLGQDVTLLFANSPSQFHRDILPSIRRHGTISGVEQVCRTRNGALLPVLLSGVLLPAQPDAAAGIVCVLADISYLKHMEQELRVSEARFRMIADFTYDWEYWVGEDGRYLYVSPSCERITGYAPEVFQADPDWLKRIIHSDDRQRVAEHLHGEGQCAGAFSTRFRITTRDGEERWIGHACQPVYDREGRRLGQRASNRDITAQVQVEETLRMKEECYRAVVEGTDDLIIQVDADGYFTYVNHNTERLYGLPPEECLGRLAFDFVHPDDRVRTEMAFMTWMQNGITSATFENRLLSQTGEVYSMLWTINPHYNTAGEMTSITAIARDITEMKRVEAELRQTNISLTTWVAELEQRTHEITILSELSEVLQICTSVEEAYGVIVRFARRLFPGDSGMLGVRRTTQRSIEPVVVWGELPINVRDFTNEECWALRLGRVHVVDDPLTDIMCAHVHAMGGQSSICVPLTAQGETLGVLHLQMAPPVAGREAGLNRRTSEAKQHLAVALAKQVALALSNVRLRVTLRRQSIRDPLTGLFNRRYLDETLERELRRAERADHPVGVVMLDIDHFKQFNDTYGHDGGDTLLRSMAEFLQLETRGEDIVCRYGGEEFVLIMPGASLEDTHRRAEQVRASVKQMQVQHAGQTLGSVSVSLGVAVFPIHGATSDEVLKAADSALYRAKAGGRDQVVFAEMLVYPLNVSY
ncbi:MAG: diguanylate cyclase [Chloroflexaceae bacterium]